METKILKPTFENLKLCANLLKKGEIIGAPTETVYGLAANAFDYDAVSKIFKVKGRPQDNPLICHVNSIKMFRSLTDDNSVLIEKLITNFWPGPLTIIVKKCVAMPINVTAGLETVGIRFSSNKILNQLIGMCSFPLAAPSANLSKKPSSTNAHHVANDFNGKIPAILDGGTCSVGVESTIVKIENGCCVLLRPGFITLSMLKHVSKNVEIDKGILIKHNSNKQAICPGTKHLHYSPKADVVVVKGSLSSFIKYVSEKLNSKIWCAVFDGEQKYFNNYVLTYGKEVNEQAKNLFSVLRKVDDLNLDKIFFRSPSEHDLGLAVYNRLIRAADFNVINLD